MPNASIYIPNNFRTTLSQDLAYDATLCSIPLAVATQMAFFSGKFYVGTLRSEGKVEVVDILSADLITLAPDFGVLTLARAAEICWLTVQPPEFFTLPSIPYPAAAPYDFPEGSLLECNPTRRSLLEYMKANPVLGGVFSQSSGTSGPVPIIEPFRVLWQEYILERNVSLSAGFDGPYPNAQVATHFYIVFIQDGAGGHTVTAWPSNVKWAGGVAPTFDTTADSRTIIEFFTYDEGSTLWGVMRGTGFI